MLDVAKAQEFLDSVTTARIAGNIDALMSHFHDDAAFQVMGLSEAAVGSTAIRAMLEGLVDQFEFIEWEPLDMVANGETIAVRQHLKVRHRSSGQVAATQTAEFFTIRHGRCIALTQFADTALVAELGRGA